MIDSRTAAHKAFYAALTASIALTAVADVWAHPEQGTEATPDKALVLIGLARFGNAGGKDGDLDEVTIDVLVEVRKPDPTELYSVSHLVRKAVEGQALAVNGATISPPETIGGDADLEEDGETYFDTLRFRTFVQPED